MYSDLWEATYASPAISFLHDVMEKLRSRPHQQESIKEFYKRASELENRMR